MPTAAVGTGPPAPTALRESLSGLIHGVAGSPSGSRLAADAEKRRGPFQWGVSQPSCSTETKPEAEIVCEEIAELQYNTVGHSATPVNACETKPGYYSPTECPVLEYPETVTPAGEEYRMSLTISQGGVFDPLNPRAGASLCGHLEAAVHHEPRSTREWELLGTSGPTCNITV